MKKLKNRMLCAVAIIILGMTAPALNAFADNELLITFQIDTGEASFPMVVSMEFENEVTGKSILVECSYDTDYQWIMALDEGKYTLVSYKVYSSGSGTEVPQDLDYIVEFNDFSVSLSEGDKTVTGIAMDRATYEAIYGAEEETEEAEEEEPLDSSWIHDGTTDHNVANPLEATNEADIAYYTIPQDNEYFPGWTVIEIQEWYKQQVRNYLDTDYAQNYLQTHEYAYADENEYTEFFYEKVAAFAAEDIIYYPTEEYGPKGPGQSLRGLNGFTMEIGSAYSSLVDVFESKSECTEFYEVNKRLLDFIMQYYWETGIQLNFNIWEYSDLPEVVAFPEISLDSEEEDAAPVPDIPAPDTDDDIETSNSGEGAVEMPEKENDATGFILIGIICAVVVCGAGVGVYFYRKKDR